MLLSKGKQGNFRALLYAEELDLLLRALGDPDHQGEPMSAEETLCLAQIIGAMHDCADTGEQVMVDARPVKQPE